MLARTGPSEDIIPIARPPHVAVRHIGGHPYLLTVWLDAQWERLPEWERPATAQRLGSVGWCDIQPLGRD